MEKDKILYVSRSKHLSVLECSEWYEAIKSVLTQNISIMGNRIETPYAIIEFVHRRPLFTRKYDLAPKADKQDSDVTLFALALGKNY